MSERPVTAVPAIGVSVAVDCLDGRGLTVQTHIERDMPAADQDHILDRIMAMANRQRAVYELPMFEAKLAELDHGFERRRDAAKQADEYHATMQAKRVDDLDKAKKDRDETAQKAYNKHVTTGRQSNFELQGAGLARFNALDGDVQRIEAQINAADNEYKSGRASFEVEERRWTLERDTGAANIARSKAALEG